MSIEKRKVQGIWSSRWTFFAAAAVLVAGLGDFSVTPQQMGGYGGRGYLVIYIASLVLIMMPVAVAELRVALRARSSPIHAVSQLASHANASHHWALVAQLASIVALLIASRLAVVGGWLFAYVGQSAQAKLEAASLDTVAATFQQLLSSGETQWHWSAVFILVVILFSSLSVVRGLAVLLRVVLPLLLLVLVVLGYYAAELGDIQQAKMVLFDARAEDLGWLSAFSALQMAFFSLSIGSLSLMAYGAYFPSGRSVTRQIGMLVMLDILIMILGGLLVLSLVLDQHIVPASGPALLFISLPFAFANVVFGDIAGAAFFGVLAVLAVTSAVALIEPAVAYIVERWAAPRWLAAPLVVSVMAAMTYLLIQSMAGDSSLHWFGRDLHEWVDIVTAQLLLPFCALCFALFAGWRIPQAVYGVRENRLDRIGFWIWQLLLRYISPPALLLVLVMGLYLRLA